VEALSHREGSQKDDVAVGARCHVYPTNGDIGFLRGRGRCSTPVPPPEENIANTGIKLTQSPCSSTRYVLFYVI
jgi:hypothetical protein